MDNYFMENKKVIKNIARFINWKKLLEEIPIKNENFMHEFKEDLFTYIMNNKELLILVKEKIFETSH